MSSSFWTKEQIVERLSNDDRWVARAILLLHSKQTEDERRTEQTRHLNNQGFLPYHARKFSSFAKQGYPITRHQVHYARKKGIAKYAGTQLLAAANEKLKQLDIEIETVEIEISRSAYIDSPPTQQRVEKDLQEKLMHLKKKREMLSPKPAV